jgi:hypothetical protein
MEHLERRALLSGYAYDSTTVYSYATPDPNDTGVYPVIVPARLNNLGQVAFAPETFTGLGNPQLQFDLGGLYLSDATGGNSTRVPGFDPNSNTIFGQGLVQGIQGIGGVNDSGTMVFSYTDASNYASSGVTTSYIATLTSDGVETAIFQAGGNSGQQIYSAPVIDNIGDVFFDVVYPDTATSATFRYHDGTLTQIASGGGLVSVSNKGTVLFNASDQLGRVALFEWQNDVVSQVTPELFPSVGFISSVDVNDSGDFAYTMVGQNGGVFLDTGGQVTAIATASPDGYASFGAVSINNLDQVAFRATTALDSPLSTGTGVFTGPDLVHDKILFAGSYDKSDFIDGEWVDQIGTPFPESLYDPLDMNDQGQVAIGLSTLGNDADGNVHETTRVVRAEPRAIVDITSQNQVTDLIATANTTGQSEVTLGVSESDPTLAVAQVQDVVNSLASLPPSTGATTTVNLVLAPNISYPPQDVILPTGFKLVITTTVGTPTLDHWTVESGDITLERGVEESGMAVNGGTVTLADGTELLPGSPAVTVHGGHVILHGATATGGGNAPTILVTGGLLTVRNSTIQESSSSAQAAMEITGGIVDLGTVEDPGRNILNVNGPGALIQNSSGVAVQAFGDTFENNGVASPPIMVLNSTASGSLTVSNNTSINIPGAVIVESTSPTAISAGAKAQLSAWASGVSVPDPLAGLAGPSPSELTNYGAVVLGGNSKATKTLNPGIYTQVSISGNANVTLNSGVYIIEGGGLVASGAASLSGTGVMIYNAGSNYPNSGGNFGGITLSGSGTFNLSAPTSGPYAGVLMFQARQNTRALSISGSILSGLNGAIYAPSALLSLSGGAQLQAPIYVGMLSVSGGAALTQIAAGSDGTGDTSGIANTLLAGNLSVYVNDPNGLFTADELARIQDAINTWDAVLVPYNVTITEVSDPTQANIIIDTGTTSACGSAADGVLGCYNEPNAEITMLQGWNWYAGADPGQIGAEQYDFETTVLHELGHALGLGGSTDPSSPMYETLAAGLADRTPTTQDLNIPDPPAGADPQMAAGFRPGSLAMPSLPSGHPVAVGVATNLSPAGLMPLMSAGSPWSVVRGPWSAAGVHPGSQAGLEPELVLDGTNPDRGHGAVLVGFDDGQVLDAVLADLEVDTDRDRSRGKEAGERSGVPDLPGAGEVKDTAEREPEGVPPARIDPTAFAHPGELPTHAWWVERGLIRVDAMSAA